MNIGQMFVPDDVLRQLEPLLLASKSRIRGTTQGQRRSKQQGSSLEFADYRLYTPGDDIRQLDWNAYGRTGKPFIKLFMDEQELQVNLYIDASGSMNFNFAAPEHNKFFYARQLAACIGYIALCGYDRVSARLFSDHLSAQLPLLRGKGSAFRLFDFLAKANAEASGDIASAIMRPASLPRQSGMAWVFSDFLYESGVEEALISLIASRQEVVVVQVLNREELEPQLLGDLRLIDFENGDYKDVAVSHKVLQTYRAAVQQYTHALQRFCREHAITYQLLITDTPIAEAVMRLFRHNGLVL